MNDVTTPIICTCILCQVASKWVVAAAVFGFFLICVTCMLKMWEILQNCKAREKRLKTINNRRRGNDGCSGDQGAV